MLLLRHVPRLLVLSNILCRWWTLAKLQSCCRVSGRGRDVTAGCFAGNSSGFFLGDVGGFGIGRQIAAIIREEHARSSGATRTLWLSVSNDLRYDAERDLSDVGAKNIKVFPEVGIFHCKHSYQWQALDSLLKGLDTSV